MTYILDLLCVHKFVYKSESHDPLLRGMCFVEDTILSDTPSPPIKISDNQGISHLMSEMRLLLLLLLLLLFDLIKKKVVFLSYLLQAIKLWKDKQL
jgi:hypothetical protein